MDKLEEIEENYETEEILDEDIKKYNFNEEEKFFYLECCKKNNFDKKNEKEIEKILINHLNLIEYFILNKLESGVQKIQNFKAGFFIFQNFNYWLYLLKCGM